LTYGLQFRIEDLLLVLHFSITIINGKRYRELILHEFINQLNDEELQHGYFQQDGAKPKGVAMIFCWGGPDFKPSDR
jgi:hypothetical protein